jgi:hypothetical protein
MPAAPMRTLMINTIGEPCSGKSTFSFWLVQELKRRGVRAEFVPEVVKYETYSEDRVARLLSTTIDQRLMMRQHGFVRPLLGRTEVIVNDGPLTSFFFYSQIHMPPERFARMRTLMERYMTEQRTQADVRYVAPVRTHAYDTSGRYHSEAESLAIRAQLLGSLQNAFGIVPTVLTDEARRQRFADDLVAEVFQNRLALREPSEAIPERPMSRRRPR